MNNHVFRLLNALQKSDYCSLNFRRKILKLMGVRVATGAVIMSGCDFLKGDISIGRNSFINQRCLFEGAGGITVGEEVRIGHGVMLLTSTHEMGDRLRRAGPLITHTITVGDGCWLGAGCVVISGAEICARTIVAAMSLVRGRLEHDAMYAGAPATMRKHLS